MSSSRRQQHPARRRRPRRCSGGRCGSPTRCSTEWWTLVAERAGPGGRPDGGEARARALDRRALARRGGGARGRGALHAGRAASTRRPRRCRSVALPGRRPGPPAGAPRRAFGDSASQARRLIDQGGVKLDGEPVTRARRAAGAARRARSSRRASGGSSGSTQPFDSTLGPCYTSPAAREGGVGKSLQTTQRSASGRIRK